MKTKHKLLMAGALTGMTALGAAGGSLINTISANADSAAAGTTATLTAVSTSASPAPGDPSQGGHTANGITETVLTGDTATKAIAAAEAAEPGATVIRAETDADGAKYEVHMKKSDGSLVTVKLDANFKVTATEDGMGAGGPAAGGTPGSGSGSSSS